VSFVVNIMPKPIRLKSKSAAAVLRILQGKERQKRAAKRKAAEKPLVWPGVGVEILAQADGLLDLVLPVRLSNDNDGQRRHWSKSARRRKELGLQVRAWFPHVQPFPFPVRVTVTRVLGKGERLWDHDSVGRGNAKQLIDSFKACGLIVNDDPRWIAAVAYAQDATDRREYSRTRIKFERA